LEFRIAQITDDRRGVLTGAFVFSPPPHLPDVPRVMVERFGAENTKLGPHGWAVDSRGLRPRVIEKRGAELWLCFGAEVSFHVLPNTPVRVSLMDTEVEGTEIWPPIPRGKAPPADIPPEDAPWPEPAAAEPPEPAPAPAPAPTPAPTPAPAPAPPPPPIAKAPIAKAPEATAHETVIVKPAPAPPPKDATPPVVVDPPPPTGDGRKPPIMAILAAVLLLLAAGGAAWWYLQPAPPVQEAAAPTPTPPAPPPATPGCAGVAEVLAGTCTPEQMNRLPPAEQTRLAEALLANPDRRAGDLAIALLNAASSNHAHPPAMALLGRLYDPATFRQGGPLRSANATRALDLFGRAAETGHADAATARAALIARLKQQAAGNDEAAQAARATLAAAGIQ